MRVAPIACTSFFRDIREGRLPRCCLFEGVEEYTKEKALEQLIEKAVGDNFPDINVTTLRDPPPDELIACAETVPFMADKRVLVVRDYAMLSGKVKDYDEDMAGRILAESDDFWPYVEHDQMPEADGSEQADAFIKKEYAEGDETKTKEATDEITELVKKLSYARKAQKEAKAAEDEIANRIKVFMGNATAVAGLCTWKNEKDSVKVNWESVASEAMSGMDADARRELVNRYTTITPGKRPLKITAKGL